MKKIDLAQAVTILANVGVIAGIVFLGIELQQNNALLTADARRNRAAHVEDNFALLATDPELASVLI